MVHLTFWFGSAMGASVGSTTPHCTGEVSTWIAEWVGEWETTWVKALGWLPTLKVNWAFCGKGDL